MSSLLAPKVALIAVVGVATFIASLAPFLVAARIATTRALRIIATASAAAAGVVVGAFLCHLLPEASEAFTDYLSDAYGADARIATYPFAQLLCGGVLAALVILDGMIVRRGMDGSGHSHGGDGGRSHDHLTASFAKLSATVASASPSNSSMSRMSPSERVRRGTLSGMELDPMALVGRESFVDEPLSNSGLLVRAGDEIGPGSGRHPRVRSSSTASFQLLPEPTQFLREAALAAAADRAAAVRSTTASSGIPEGIPLLRPSAAGAGLAAGARAARGPPPRSSALVVGPPAAPPAPAPAPPGGSLTHRRLVVRAWIFFLALSLHGVFDGLSVGSEDNVAGFTSTVVAVVSHKLFDGLSLGCALFPANLPRAHRWALLVICAATTPLGIGIGMAATAAISSARVRLVNGLALGLASGSFAYISLMELLPSSLADGAWLPLKLALFVLGFVAMAVLALFV